DATRTSRVHQFPPGPFAPLRIALRNRRALMRVDEAGRCVMGRAAVWLFASLVVLSLPAPGRAGSRGASLGGDWQTILAPPKRPWVFVVHFEPAGAGWAGRMRVEGLATFPLLDVRLDGDRLRFRFPPELDSLAFDGRLGDREIFGRVREATGLTPTR